MTSSSAESAFVHGTCGAGLIHKHGAACAAIMCRDADERAQPYFIPGSLLRDLTDSSMEESVRASPQWQSTLPVLLSGFRRNGRAARWCGVRGGGGKGVQVWR
jgi:hypothetical protein